MTVPPAIPPAQISGSDSPIDEHVPGSTYRVVTGGHSYPLDHDGSTDVFDAINAAIVREVAAGLVAPDNHVEVTDIDYPGGEYVTVFLAVRAPLNNEPMTAFWTGSNR